MSPLPHAPRRARPIAIAIAASLLLAACQGRDAAGDARAPTPAHPAIAPAPRTQPADVLETTSAYIVGISYPKGLSNYPGLATIAERYADAARRQVVDAARERPAEPGASPYELSLEFQLRHESPRIVVLAVDGSSYTGGAHGMPMVQRWVWLPPQSRLLTVADLFPDRDSWARIATDVRTQLRTELAQRLDADGVAPQERAALMKSAGAMIDGGTEPGPEDFAVFEPVFDAQDRIVALRFVFPPYQVGPYAEGVRTVELPASRLVQDVAPAYRALFAATT